MSICYVPRVHPVDEVGVVADLDLMLALRENVGQAVE